MTFENRALALLQIVLTNIFEKIPNVMTFWEPKLHLKLASHS